MIKACETLESGRCIVMCSRLKTSFDSVQQGGMALVVVNEGKTILGYIHQISGPISCSCHTDFYSSSKYVRCIVRMGNNYGCLNSLSSIFSLFSCLLIDAPFN